MLLAPLLVISLATFGQTGIVFLINKLYVVQTEYPYFDSCLKVIMRNTWNISEIGGFISRKELKELAKSKDNSFLDPTTHRWEVRSNMNSSRQFNAIFFYQGPRKTPDLKNITTYIYFGGEAGDNFDSCVYRLELMIRTVMNEFKNAASMDSVKRIYNLSLLKKKKILLVNTKFMNHSKKMLDNIAKDAFDNYPFKVEFASSTEIASYIKAKDKRYVLSCPVVNDQTRKVHLYDVETGFFIGSFERSGVFALPIRAKDVDGLVDLINE